MSESIELTVITPVFNAGRFIKACLRNVLDQYRPGIEHLIVDGGSTDRTVEFIQQFAAQHPHVRWISEKDRGQSDAMNRGLALARGESVSFLNVDDSYCPGALSEALTALSRLPAPAFVVGDCQVEDADGHVLYVSKPQNLTVEEMLIARPLTVFPINPASYFYHKSLHEKIGLFDCADHQTMDVDFLFRAFAAVTPVYFQSTWAIFRLHDRSKTALGMQSGNVRVQKNRVYRRYFRTLPFPRRVRCRFLKGYYKCLHAIRFARPNLARLLGARIATSKVRRET